MKLGAYRFCWSRCAKHGRCARLLLLLHALRLLRLPLAQPRRLLHLLLVLCVGQGQGLAHAGVREVLQEPPERQAACTCMGLACRRCRLRPGQLDGQHRRQHRVLDAWHVGHHGHGRCAGAPGVHPGRQQRCCFVQAHLRAGQAKSHGASLRVP